jgi:HD-GYP domain-containing protein (c-di-GMP phosphodiesterase class II)
VHPDLRHPTTTHQVSLSVGLSFQGVALWWRSALASRIETGDHLEQVSNTAGRIASAIESDRGHPPGWAERVAAFAPLHDVGKLRVPAAILRKPGPLDPAEWETMKAHTTIGARLVVELAGRLGVHHVDDVAMMRNIVELHHEKLDGTGYPHGLAGADIPDEARVVAVADIHDALSRRRSYKEAWCPARVRTELAELGRSGKLDDGCVQILLDLTAGDPGLGVIPT